MNLRRVSGLPVLIYFSIVWFALIGGFSVLINGIAYADVAITSTYTSSPPAIDGILEEGEWEMENKIEFDHGFVTVRNDLIRLYILIDLRQDRTDDLPDYFDLTFDTNENSNIDSADLNYTIEGDSYNLRYQHYDYRWPYGWVRTDLMRGSGRSSLSVGFGCFYADGSIVPVADGWMCDEHRVWEIGIDLAEIDAVPGDSVRMGLMVQSGTPSFVDYVPEPFFESFENLINVSLASVPGGLPSHDPSASISFNERYDTDFVEVTQAIQDKFNNLPLVENKTTVAKVYVETTGVDLPQPAILYLHGYRDGDDLPGSPLSMLFMAPLYDFPSIIPNRSELSTTANFLLPNSWLHGDVRLTGWAIDMEGNFDSSYYAVDITFESRCVPTLWVVPIWEGIWTPEFEPVVVGDEEINRQVSLLETIYPIPHINAVKKGVRSAWGLTIPPPEERIYGIIEDLNGYYDWVAYAWAASTEPSSIPDQIFGIRVRNTVSPPRPFGTSDPVWAGGRGYVAAGYGGGPFLDDSTAVSFESLMAHEVNHNLDKRRRGEATWGHHAVEARCPAPVPDPDWPYTNGSIQEPGFDTRRPWVERTDVRTTVMSPVYPNGWYDLMTYCSKGTDPDRWISPYRWERLFEHFSECGTLPTSRMLYQVRGLINDQDDGELMAIFVLPGLPTEDTDTGEYSVELHNQEKLLYKVPFAISFEDVEGMQRNKAYFHLSIPEIQGTSKIILKKGDEILDKIEASGNFPTVSVDEPKQGEKWSGKHIIRWSASDQDGDALHFTILYSPNEGKTWYPVAWNLQGQGERYEYELDTSNFPGGEEGRIRVIVSDGFNTKQDDSEVSFSVERKPPDVSIVSPRAGTEVSQYARVLFEGRAIDLEDGSLLDGSFRWSRNGEEFAVGSRVNARFPVGVQQVTLKVTDSDTEVGQDSIEIHVFPDADADDVPDEEDNCKYIPNADQSDQDTDGTGNVCDNCIYVANANQADEDKDGVGDMCDICPDTTIPEEIPTVKLGTNRFALVNDDHIFDTVRPNGKGPEKQYTIENTKGCSCSQIVEKLGLGKGHVKFGCSISAMDDFVTSLEK